MTLPPFQSLVDEHGRDVHRFLRGLVGPTAAEDCLQEALMAALVAYPNLRHASNLRSWLFTIAHRKGIDHLRKASRETLTEVLPERAVAPHEAENEALWREVNGLPTKQRASVTLRFVGDLAYKDIARIIDSTEAAARQNVRAGLATLKKEFA